MKSVLLYLYRWEYCKFPDDVNGRMKAFMSGTKSTISNQVQVGDRYAVKLKILWIFLCIDFL